MRVIDGLDVDKVDQLSVINLPEDLQPKALWFLFYTEFKAQTKVDNLRGIVLARWVMKNKVELDLPAKFLSHVSKVIEHYGN